MTYTDKQLQVATQIAYMNFNNEFIQNYYDENGEYPTLGYLLNDPVIGAQIYDDFMRRYDRSSDLEIVRYDSVAQLFTYIKGDNVLSNWKIANVNDQNSSNGFYALLIETSSDSALVGFRGSESYDQTQLVNDWGYADLGLLNSVSTSQLNSAADYMSMINSNYSYSDYTATGHSLGGNLATHAVIAAPDSMISKISHVYSFDGPGFSDEYISAHSDQISQRASLITHYQWSFVGAILNHISGSDYRTIRTNDLVYGSGEMDALTLKHDTCFIEFDENGYVVPGSMDSFAQSVGAFTRAIDDAPELFGDIIVDLATLYMELDSGTKTALNIAVGVGALAFAVANPVVLIGAAAIWLWTEIDPDAMGETIIPFALNAVTGIIGAFNDWNEFYSDIVDMPKEAILELFKYTGMDGIVSDTFDYVYDTIAHPLDTLGDVYDGVKDGINTVSNAVGDFFGSIFGSKKKKKIFTGTSGDDAINGNSSSNVIYAYSGNDTIHGGDGNDLVYGGAGNDTLYGEDGEDELYSEAGNDIISGDIGNDFIDGGDGNDELHGGDGDDSVFGGDGDDTLHGDSGNDYLEGGNGNNTMYGGDGEDTFVGGEDIDYMYGESGNDYFIGGNGSNYMYGGEGDDTFQGGEDEDYMEGGIGSDNMSGGNGYNEIYGQEGNDIIYDGDNASHIEGGSDNDNIYAGGGDDYIDGGEGNDYLQGDHGDDTYILKSGYGTDTISDCAGTNTIEFTGLSASQMKAYRTNWSDLTVTFEGTLDKLIIQGYFNGGGFRNFNLVFDDGTIMHATDADSPFNVIHGSENDDWMSVTDNNGGALYGEGGNDGLSGGNGIDTLYGGIGNDTLNGNDGDDVLDGGIGNDHMYGGNGDDTYVFGMGYGSDTIEDWGGSSRVVFSNINSDGMTISNLYNSSLVMTVTGTDDTLTINGYLYNNGGYTFEFADGVTGTVNKDTWQLELVYPESAAAPAETTEPEAEESAIQTNADLLAGIYKDDTVSAELFSETDNALISDTTETSAIISGEESNEISEQTDIQTIVLIDNMAAFAQGNNISNSNIDLLNSTDSTVAMNQFLVSAQ